MQTFKSARYKHLISKQYLISKPSLSIIFLNLPIFIRSIFVIFIIIRELLRRAREAIKTNNLDLKFTDLNIFIRKSSLFHVISIYSIFHLKMTDVRMIFASIKRGMLKEAHRRSSG